MKTSSRTLLLPMLAALLAAPGLSAQDYTVVDLGALGYDVSRAHDINASGQVTGDTLNASGNWRAFLWTTGSMLEVPALTGYASDYGYGYGMNNTGMVVGESGYTHPFFWDGFTTIHLGGLGGDSGVAFAINDSVQIAGRSLSSAGYDHAFLWENGVMTDLGTLGTTPWGRSEARDINQAGQIVGMANDDNGDSHAFLWENSVMTKLAGLSSGYGIAYGISDNGFIVGMSTTDSPWYRSHATLWVGGSAIDLGTLKDPDPGTSYALDVNSSGQVVGWSHAHNTFNTHAFLFENGVMKDLNDLIDPGSGWELEEATGINDRGQIVGWGDYQGHLRGFLLEPGGGGVLTLADPVPGQAGVVNRFVVTEATPGARVYFTYGLQAGSTSVPGCLGLAVGIAGAVTVPPVIADPAGQAGLDYLVPAAASGRTVLIQAVEPSSCSISNLVSFTFP